MLLAENLLFPTPNLKGAAVGTTDPVCEKPPEPALAGAWYPEEAGV